MLLRVKPLYDLLKKHTCDRGDEECLWCCVREHAVYLMDGTTRKQIGCPLAAMVLRGRFGVEYSVCASASMSKVEKEKKRKALTASKSGMLSLCEVKKGKGYRIGPQSDACAFLQRLVGELLTCPSSIGVLRGLFCSAQRQRIGCRCVECTHTVDAVCWHEVVRLEVPGDKKTVELRELWEEKWAEHTDPELCFRCDDERCDRKSRCEQFYLEKEPACLIIELNRIGRTGESPPKKITTPVRYPQTLDWMRTGEYKCASVIHHLGDTVDAGHYTATCMVANEPSRASVDYYHFDDDKSSSVGKTWKWLEESKQQRSASVLLYVRVSQKTEEKLSGPMGLQYVVGDQTHKLCRGEEAVSVSDDESIL